MKIVFKSNQVTVYGVAVTVVLIFMIMVVGIGKHFTADTQVIDTILQMSVLTLALIIFAILALLHKGNATNYQMAKELQAVEDYLNARSGPSTT